MSKRQGQNGRLSCKLEMKYVSKSLGTRMLSTANSGFYPAPRKKLGLRAYCRGTLKAGTDGCGSKIDP